MNQTQNPADQKIADESAPPPAQIEVQDLEPEQDVSGGSKCQNNLKQMGIA